MSPTRLFSALIVSAALVCAACGPGTAISATPQTQAPTASPTGRSTQGPTPEAIEATPDSNPASIPILDPAVVCAATTYRNCLKSFELIISMVSEGDLVAVCEYGDETGDIVLIDQIEQAADECSAGGTIKPSRVVAVGRLPSS